MWMRKLTHWLWAAAVALVLAGAIDVGFLCEPAHAGVASKVLQEGIEGTARIFGREVAEEGLEVMTKKMSSLAAKHGDELVAAAFKKVGPRAGKIVSEAGEHADDLLRLMAKHGDAATRLQRWLPFLSEQTVKETVEPFFLFVVAFAVGPWNGPLASYLGVAGCCLMLTYGLEKDALQHADDDLHDQMHEARWRGERFRRSDE